MDTCHYLGPNFPNRSSLRIDVPCRDADVVSREKLRLLDKARATNELKHELQAGRVDPVNNPVGWR